MGFDKDEMLQYLDTELQNYRQEYDLLQKENEELKETIRANQIALEAQRKLLNKKEKHIRKLEKSL